MAEFGGSGEGAQQCDPSGCHRGQQPDVQNDVSVVVTFLWMVEDYEGSVSMMLGDKSRQVQ